MNHPPLLSVRDLKTCFHTREGEVKAVDGISFDLHQGETFGIVGESGSGKSVANLSILRLIASPPGEICGGQILFAGKDLVKCSETEMRQVRGNQISMVFQDPMTSLNPLLKISRQMTEVLEQHRGLSRAAALKQAIEMLDVVGIPSATSRVHDYPHQFSGGMRQRVMIAMALLCQPKILIADEPTTALDVTIQAQILELLQHLQEEFQMAIVLITHNLGVAATICDRIAVMYAGRFVEYGTAEDIFERPRHPYTVGLLHSIPRLDEATTDRLTAIPGQPPDLVNAPSGCPFHPRCSYAIERCHTAYPPPVHFADGHYSRCFRAEEVNKA